MIDTIPRSIFRQAIEDGITADAESPAPALTEDDRAALRDLGHNAQQIGRSFLTPGCGCPLVETGIVPVRTVVGSPRAVQKSTVPYESFWATYDRSLSGAEFGLRARVCQIVEG